MSEKIVQIDGKDVALRCSGATYIKYRTTFKKDLFVEMQKMGESVTEDGMLGEGAIEVMLRATYIMARQADSSIDIDFEEWLDQFSLMGAVEGIEGVYELLLGDRETLDEAKKNNDQMSAE